MYEVDLLSLRYRRVQERQDRRAALAAWMLANVHRDSEQRSEPFSLEEVVEWLGYSRHRSLSGGAAQPPTTDQLLDRIQVLNEVYGGQSTTNGAQ